MLVPDFHIGFSSIIQALGASETVPSATEVISEPGIFESFGLDPIAFLIQLVNFLIVFLVFKKIIAGPLTKVMADRQAKIDKGLADAKELANAKQEFSDWRSQETASFRSELKKAQKQAEQANREDRDQIIDQARQQASLIIDQSKQDLADTKQQLIREVRVNASSLIGNAVRKLGIKNTDKDQSQAIDQALDEWEQNND
ncbi:ATP synthase F0 subunit B [Candidatus Saccharibacteria bacterium]|nr:ATP synthase F0 subunit B [Candidatus Saccharibacteria bacterium]